MDFNISDSDPATLDAVLNKITIYNKNKSESKPTINNRLYLNYFDGNIIILSYMIGFERCVLILTYDEIDRLITNNTIQAGGNGFKQKYLKYKQKYLELKKLN